jgi:hypothetical protein
VWRRTTQSIAPNRDLRRLAALFGGLDMRRQLIAKIVSFLFRFVSVLFHFCFIFVSFFVSFLFYFWTLGVREAGSSVKP